MASPGDEIHVAGGTYKPDQDGPGHLTAGDREGAFERKSGVSLFVYDFSFRIHTWPT